MGSRPHRYGESSLEPIYPQIRHRSALEEGMPIDYRICFDKLFVYFYHDVYFGALVTKTHAGMVVSYDALQSSFGKMLEFLSIDCSKERVARVLSAPPTLRQPSFHHYVVEQEKGGIAVSLGCTTK
jgi:hypothetical protein